MGGTYNSLLTNCVALTLTGRGPLVRSALKASERCESPIRLYAVEKNPNAMTILQCLVEAENWKARGFQELVHEDMRTWEAPEKVWPSTV